MKSFPTQANTPAPNELEYLDVFDIFNFPRLPVIAAGFENGNAQTLNPKPASALNPALIPNFAVPDPDTDWLYSH